MNTKSDTPAESGLRFFGGISAAVTHDLKNVLTIINENAGLLEDLALMADRGVSPNPDRLKLIAVKVKNQISRADVILKNLNRFAHSTYETFAGIDLNENIELLLALSNRYAALRSVAIKAKYSEDPVMFKTAPFYLIYLLRECFDFAVEASGASKSIEISVQKTANGAQIRFGGLEGVTQEAGAAFAAGRSADLLMLLGAEVLLNAADCELVVSLAGNKE